MPLETSQRSTKHNLLSRTLDSIRQCQIQFADGKQLGTDTDSRVSCVISQLEAIFHHGLKTVEPSYSVLRSVSSAVSKTLDGSSNSLENDDIPDQVPLWSFIRHHLGDTELQRFTKLKFITTDSGCGRAWLRSALNEKCLSRYVESFLSKPELLKEYYEPWAFLRDDEISATLPQIAAGLNNILFAINIDNSDLNNNRNLLLDLNDISLSVQMEAKPAPQPIVNVTNRNSSKDRSIKVHRRRKPTVNIVSFEDSRRLTGAEGTMKVMPQIRRLSSSRSGSISASVHSFDDVISEFSSVTDDTFPEAFLEDEPVVGITGVNGTDAIPEYPETFTPVIESDPPTQTPVISNPVYSEDTNSMGFKSSVECIDAGVNETDSLTLVSEEANRSGYDDADAAHSSENSSLCGDSILEMKNHSNHSSVVPNSNQESQIRQLETELELFKLTQNENELALAERLSHAERENETLRDQIRIYAQNSAAALKEEREHNDALDEVGQYEQKLVEVAQMHAELVEFNGDLQKQLQLKDAQLRRLRAELFALRGPLSTLPPAVVSGGVGSIAKEDLNIWIPSAVLTGKGTDVHHIYQVYIRIRDSEWNVFRRYSQFRMLHVFLVKRKVPLSAFPAKSNLHKKDKLFVEDRRKGLELYLRNAVQNVISTFPEFQSVPLTKETLSGVLTFFGEIAPREKPSSRLFGQSKKTRQQSGN